MKKYKNLIKIFLFSMLCILIFATIYPILNYKDTGGGGGWQRFYTLPDNSVDVMFFGSSHAHCTVDLGYLWEQYGIKGYTLSAGSQAIDCTYYFVKEAIERKHPKVLAVEVFGATFESMQHPESDVYGNAFGMRLSNNYIDMIQMFQDNMQKDRNWGMEHKFIFPVTHARYKKLQADDFVDTMPYLIGYRGSYEQVSFEKPQIDNFNDVADLYEDSEYYLRKIIEIAKENNTDLLLWASPYVVPEEHKARFNMVSKIADEEGVPFIDYNDLYEELELDFSKDYRDTDHVNNYGAIKVTEHLGKTLNALYHFSNHQGEDDCQLWEENATYLQDKVIRNELCEAQHLQDYLEIMHNQACGKNYIITLNGHYDVLGDIYLPQLMQLGISEEEYRQGGMFFFSGGKKIDQKLGKEYSVCYKTKYGEVHTESSFELDEDGEAKEQFEILYDNTKFETVENGVHIFVYDQDLDFPIDFVKTNIYEGTDIIHDELAWK